MKINGSVTENNFKVIIFILGKLYGYKVDTLLLKEQSTSPFFILNGRDTTEIGSSNVESIEVCKLSEFDK